MNNRILETIKNYLKQGYPEEQIKEGLQKKGLKEKEATNLIKSAKSGEETKKNNKIIFLIIGLIILILLASMFYVFYINRPGTAQEYIEEGIKYFHQDKYDKAWESFNKVKESDPNNHLVYLWLGAIHFEKGEYTEALDLLDKAEELNPDDLDIYRARGWIYYNLKEYDTALEEFKRVLKSNPSPITETSAYRGIGQIYLDRLETQKI